MSSFGQGTIEEMTKSRRRGKLLIIFSALILLFIAINFYFSLFLIPYEGLIYPLLIIIMGILMMRNGGRSGSKIIGVLGFIVVLVGVAIAIIFYNLSNPFSEFLSGGTLILLTSIAAVILIVCLIFFGGRLDRRSWERTHTDDPSFYSEYR